MALMTTNDIIGLVLAYGLIVAALVVSLIVEKKCPNIDNRKVVHIGVGNFVFVWWMFTESWVMLAFFTVPFAIILFLAMFRGNAIGESKLGELTRQGHNTGLFLYAITITVLVLFFFRDGWLSSIFPDAGREHWLAASIAIMAMTYGDGFGSVVGKRFGKHKTINGKSLEGSIGVFAAATIMSFVVLGFYTFLCTNGYCTLDYETSISFWILPPVVGLITAVTEMVCPGEYDNIFIPILTALASVLMGL